MLNRNDVNGKVRSRDDYWRAMVLNGYYMPNEKSSICTLKWMEGALRDNFSRRLIVFSEYFVLRIEETDQIDNPIYIWRLIDNKIHSREILLYYIFGLFVSFRV